jgi:hypothetical protein
MSRMKGSNESLNRKTCQPTTDIGKSKGGKGKKENPSK